MPGVVTHRTHIQIFQLVLVIPNIQYFAIHFLGSIHGIGGASLVRARNIINPREGGVQFGEFIDDMVERLVRFFHLGIQDTLNIEVVTVGVHIPTVTAVVGQLVGIPGIDTDIIHVITDLTEPHVVGDFGYEVGVMG